MKKILILISVVLFITACNSNSTTQKQEIKSLTLEELSTQASELSDAIISVQGLVTHVCREGGQKMYLTDEEKNINILVRVSQSIPEFDIALEGSNVKVTGKVIVSMVDETAMEASQKEHMENAGMDETAKENCPTEEAMEEGKTADITYYIEAAEYTELKQ